MACPPDSLEGSTSSLTTVMVREAEN
jgi:hypothetical protein